MACVPILLLWALSWSLDVGSTLRGIRRTGTTRHEQNPLARYLFDRIGVGRTFALLGAVELGFVLSLSAAAWVVSAFGTVGLVLACVIAVPVVAATLLHAAAAYGNVTGRAPMLARPILRVYDAINRSKP